MSDLIPFAGKEVRGGVKLYDGDMANPARANDPAAGVEKPCSNCGRQFQPTLRRRMLCYYCFAHADEIEVHCVGSLD